MQLTQQQLNHFDTFGYLALPGLLKDDIGWITEEFEEVMAAAAGKEHDGSERTIIVPTIDYSERLCMLLDDERGRGAVGCFAGGYPWQRGAGE